LGEEVGNPRPEGSRGWRRGLLHRWGLWRTFADGKVIEGDREVAVPLHEVAESPVGPLAELPEVLGDIGGHPEEKREAGIKVFDPQGFDRPPVHNEGSMAGGGDERGLHVLPKLKESLMWGLQKEPRVVSGGGVWREDEVPSAAGPELERPRGGVRIHLVGLHSDVSEGVREIEFLFLTVRHNMNEIILFYVRIYRRDRHG
jgi:hypothetical protein